MFRFRLNGLRAAFGGLALCWLPLAEPAATEAGVRLGQHPGFLRTVVDLPNEVPYRVWVPPDGRELVIGLPLGLGVAAPTRPNVSVLDDADETLLRVRMPKRAQAARVFTLQQDGGVPYKLVVDLQQDRAKSVRSDSAAPPFVRVAASGWQSEGRPAALEPPAAPPPPKPQALAQAPGPRPPATDYDSAFQIMLQDPSDLDAAFRFAELAVQAGDLEGAVAALERMLIFNPNLPRVRLELGVLYFRLASYQAAKGYLQGAMEAADAPADVRRRVAEYLAEIDKRLSPHRFNGSFQIGARYQTNANSANASGAVKLFGLDATLDADSAKRKDWNAYVVGDLRYAYDLDTQAGDAIELGFRAYSAKQRRISSLDVASIDGDLGPKLSFDWLLDGLNLRPYVAGGLVNLDDSQYLRSAGGGLAAELPIGERFAAEASAESRLRRFHPTDTRTTITDKNGLENVFSIGGRYALGPSDLVRGSFELTRDDDRSAAETNTQFKVGASYVHRFVEPLGLREPWTLSVFGNRTWREYAAPDTAIDPDTTRRDREWTAGATLALGIWNGIGLSIQLQQQWVSSTISNFAYRNSVISVATTYGF
jgi:tetratricopeptide (TPR) repeat protein